MTSTRRRAGAIAVLALVAWMGWAVAESATEAHSTTPEPASKSSSTATKKTQAAAKTPQTAAPKTPQAAAPSLDSAARALPDTSLPVYTGTWALDTAKSVFGNFPGGRPTSRTDVIEHDGSRIRQVLYLLRGSTRDTTTYLYSVGGAPTVNVVDKRDIKTVATWEGRMLHLVSTTHLFMFEMTMDERWQLSPEGRTLTLIRYIKYPLGEGGQRLVFERR